MKTKNICAPKRDKSLVALPCPAKGNDQVKNATTIGMERYNQAMQELARL